MEWRNEALVLAEDWRYLDSCQPKLVAASDGLLNSYDQRTNDSKKNVTHLLIEVRGIEINARLRQLTHERPVKWRPLDWGG